MITFRRRTILRVAIVALVVVCVSGATMAANQTAETTSFANLNWSDPVAWVTAPTAGLIPNNGTHQFDVTVQHPIVIDIDSTIRSFSMVSDPTISGSGNLTVNGTLDWTNGTIGGAGTLTLNGATQISPFSKSLARNTFNYGTATLVSGGSLPIASGATWSNQSGSLFHATATSPPASDVNGDGLFSNAAGAEVRKTGAERTLFLNLNNAGQVNVQEGILEVWNGTATGDFAISPGAELRFMGSYNTSGEITGAGDVRFSQGVFSFIDGSDIDVSGEVAVEFSALLGVGTSLEFQQLTLDTTSSSSSGLLINNEKVATVTDQFTWKRGSISGVGSLAVHAPATVGGNGIMRLIGTLDTYGLTSVDTTGGALILNSFGVWNNKAGGVIEVGDGSGFSSDGGGFDVGQINNHAGATMHILTAGTSIAPKFNNEGTLQVTGGSSMILGNVSQINFDHDGATPATPAFDYAVISGGTWIVENGASVGFRELGHLSAVQDQYSIVVNQGNVVLRGVSSELRGLDSNLRTNQGTLELADGRILTLYEPLSPDIPLRLSSPFLNTGHLLIGQTSELRAGTGLNSMSGSTLEGRGKIVGAVEVQGTAFHSAGALLIDGPLDVTAGVNRVATGTLNVSGVTTIGGGRLEIAAGATMGGPGLMEIVHGELAVLGTLNKQIEITGPFVLGGTLTEDATLNDAEVESDGTAGSETIDSHGDSSISGNYYIDWLNINDGTFFISTDTEAYVSNTFVEPGAYLGIFGKMLQGNGQTTIDVKGGTMKVMSPGSATFDQAEITDGADAVIDGYFKPIGSLAIENSKVSVNAGGKIETNQMEIAAASKLSGKGEVVAPINVGAVAIVSPGGTPPPAGAVVHGAQSASSIIAGGAAIEYGMGAGILTVESVTFTGGAVLELDLKDALGIAGDGFDQLHVLEDAVGSGTSLNPVVLDLVSLNAMDESGLAANFDSEQFYAWNVLVSDGTLSGFTSNAIDVETDRFLNPTGDGAFSVVAIGTNLVLRFLPGAPGDFDNSGAVDTADYVIWRNGLGTIYAPDDYDVWSTHFGQVSASAAGSSFADPTETSVPEPAMWWFVAFCSCSTLGARFRVRPRAICARSSTTLPSA